MVDSNLDPTKQIAPKDEQYNTRMLYYGLFIVGFAGILLVLYHFLIMKWCFGGSPRRGNYHERRPVVASVAVRRFKYEKSKVGLGEGECVVCLGGYEEGEEVKELPKCKHLFHASCIDMWLFSHYDCPLCRAPVEQLAQRNDDVV